MRANNDNNLFICNTVYQTMVALWISHRYLTGERIEFWISDHMNNGDIIAEKINKLCNDYKAKYIKTKSYIRYDVYWNKNPRYWRMFPQKLLAKFVEAKSTYKRIFIANMDRFAQMSYNALSHIQKTKPRLFLYEDGISTYSLFMKKMYDDTRLVSPKKYRQKIFRKICHDQSIWGNIRGALVFCPKLMSWTPSRNIRIDKIDSSDMIYRNIVNEVFDYQGIEEGYNRKYIFMEESYFADGIEVNDVQMIEKIADKVGKENIMIKIHPRNPINRFEELGYKTNKNTSIPWEVICMNNKDITDKILISISSASIVMPSVIFGYNIKAYSLLNSLSSNNAITEKIGSELIDMVKKFYGLYKVKMIESEQDLTEIINAF
ncbi:MAG: alpha-2,8-polysialyltransferase family protein [Lachnospiraceae bacterium]|nr:alpha-2,8-polysialyltransferase family protein [Lachnospiraceae bacterium]